MKFENIGLQVPTILLPRQGIDLSRWAVIACDQYTSQPEYWEQVRALTEGSPSTLDLIYPEVYLESSDRDERIRKIQGKMRQFLADRTLVPQNPGFVLVDRQTAHNASRKGLVVALDLEQYDFREGTQTLIRATEGTIVERLPPRIKVREHAEIEVSHIMVLIDDPGKTVIEPLFDRHPTPLYDTALMMNGGRVRGYLVDDEDIIVDVARRISELAWPETSGEKAEADRTDVLLFALGDGNHSFATAKVIWERLKASAENKQVIMDHPARHVLVELVNLYDDGLQFEAIHRVLFNADPLRILPSMQQFFDGKGAKFSYRRCATLAEAKETAMGRSKEHVHAIPFVAEGEFGALFVERPAMTLEVASLQMFLDEYLKTHPEATLDYIHGEHAVAELSAKPHTMGFLLPALPKFQFFKSIARDGALPRKTFSMGEADEKRFYLECRRIVP